MRVEAVPEVGAGHGVPGPVGGLEVAEDDPGFGEPIGGVAPDVEVSGRAARGGPAGPLEPGVLVGGVGQHQLGDDPQAPPVGLAQKELEVPEGPVGAVDPPVVGDVVAVVTQRGGIEREEPQGRHPQVLEVVQPGDEPPEVADPVAVGVLERPDVDLVDDGVLVPVRPIGAWRGRRVRPPRGGHRCHGPQPPRRSRWKTWAGTISGSSRM